MQENKKFDFATVAVIIVSIGLTLGGFYLLNQSFAKTKIPEKNMEVTKTLNSQTLTVASLTPTISSSSAISFVSDTPLQNSSSNSSSSTVSSQINFSSLGTSSSSSLSSSFSSSSLSNSSQISSNFSQPSSSNSSSSTVSNLSKAEATFKVIETKDGKYTIQILDTGYKGGKYWKTDAKFKINSTLDLKTDQEYKVLDITEIGDAVEFGVIKSKN